MAANAPGLFLLAATLLFPLAGCQDAKPPSEEASDGIDMASAADLAGESDLGPPGPSTSLSGTIRRTATPKAGGKGPLYVAVFDGNPVVDSKNAVLVSQTLIPDVDFSLADAQVTYRILGIPISAKERQVLAFLDDNRTAKPPNPGPDVGDLVTLDGFGGIKVKLPTEQDVTLNLVLNAVIPKL